MKDGNYSGRCFDIRPGSGVGPFIFETTADCVHKMTGKLPAFHVYKKRDTILDYSFDVYLVFSVEDQGRLIIISVEEPCACALWREPVFDLHIEDSQRLIEDNVPQDMPGALSDRSIAPGSVPFIDRILEVSWVSQFVPWVDLAGL